jgi:hypothetical protein
MSSPLSTGQSRLSLEDFLYRRAGELAAHLGRYDMYAVLIESLLVPPAGNNVTQLHFTLRTRGESITQLLRLRKIPQGLRTVFSTIDGELQEILSRHEIAARNSAVIGKLRNASPRSRPVVVLERDWYDHANASDQEVSRFIDDLERDILRVVGLYIRMAAFTDDVSRTLGRLH